MAKHLVDLDEDLLAEARRILNAATMKETVNRSLQEVIALERRQRHVERLTKMAGLDLDDPEVMSGAWR